MFLEKKICPSIFRAHFENRGEQYMQRPNSDCKFSQIELFVTQKNINENWKLLHNVCKKAISIHPSDKISIIFV